MWVSAVLPILTLIATTGGQAQDGSRPPHPSGGVGEFIHSLVGEWSGTYVEFTDGLKADDKYFHAVIRQSGYGTYESRFNYYRLDPKTGVPIKVGNSIMTTKIAPDGTATNSVTGDSQVLIKPDTYKPEQHDLSEVLRVSPAGGLQGMGSGSINVSGMLLGAGKHGKVGDYRSAWSQSNRVLTITQALNIKFKVLFFSQSFSIVAKFTARPGSDLAGLMKTAGQDARRASAASQR